MNYIGIDYGHKNIGLSWGSDELRIAVPLNAIIRAKSLNKLWQQLQNQIQTHGCDAFVIGLPLHQDGTEGRRVQEVKIFTKYLQAYFNKPIFYQDERLSTQTAAALPGSKSQSLKQLKKNKTHGFIDSKAAMIILQDFLDNL